MSAFSCRSLILPLVILGNSPVFREQSWRHTLRNRNFSNVLAFKEKNPSLIPPNLKIKLMFPEDNMSVWFCVCPSSTLCTHENCELCALWFWVLKIISPCYYSSNMYRTQMFRLEYVQMMIQLNFINKCWNHKTFILENHKPLLIIYEKCVMKFKKILFKDLYWGYYKYIIMKYTANSSSAQW